MEFEDQADHDDEEMGIPPAPEYDSSRLKMANLSVGEMTVSNPKKPKYKECLKNHAIGIGGHALDGCGEFMPAGEENTLESLKCAACNCHRNFHRKETDAIGGDSSFFHHHHHHHHPPHFSPYYRTPAGYLHVAPHTRPLALPSTSGGGDQEDLSNPSGGDGGGGVGSSRKRFRTKFSQEQKDRMLEMAERLGWRIQKQDEAAVEEFCSEMGVKRQVLKVWMHNNKHTLGKKP